MNARESIFNDSLICVNSCDLIMSKNVQIEIETNKIEKNAIHNSKNFRTSLLKGVCVDLEPLFAFDATGITRIYNNSVQVQQGNGHITVEGVEDGTMVSVYDIKGVQIGSAIVEGGKVSIPTNLQTSSIAIVKVKDKSIKVIK